MTDCIFNEEKDITSFHDPLTTLTKIRTIQFHSEKTKADFPEGMI